MLFTRYVKKPRNVIQRQENVAICLKLIDFDDVTITNIGAGDIVRGKALLVLLILRCAVDSRLRENLNRRVMVPAKSLPQTKPPLTQPSGIDRLTLGLIWIIILNYDIMKEYIEIDDGDTEEEGQVNSDVISNLLKGRGPVEISTLTSIVNSWINIF